MHVRRMGAVSLAVLLAAGCSAARGQAAGTPTPTGDAAQIGGQTGGAPGQDAGPVIQVSLSHCGQGWARPKAGDQVLRFANTGDLPAEVYVVETASGAIHAEMEGLAPRVTRSLRLTLGPGTYAVKCQVEDNDPVLGPPTTVTGGAPGGPAVVPVTFNDLYQPAQNYKKYVIGGLKTLMKKTTALTRAIDRKDRAAARAAWLPAHLAYERLGAAYGTFGDFDTAIDGLPAGLPHGVGDSAFTGFHRVEHGLWHGEPMTKLRASAHRLDKDVRAMGADFPGERLDPADLPLRAHEILEGTLEFQLTGRADQGSGTTLATAAANLTGTRETIGVLRGLLRPRYPEMARVDSLLDKVESLLNAQRHGDRWTPVGHLDPRDRASIDGAVGDLLERLSSIATICYPRRTT